MCLGLETQEGPTGFWSWSGVGKEGKTCEVKVAGHLSVPSGVPKQGIVPRLRVLPLAALVDTDCGVGQGILVTWRFTCKCHSAERGSDRASAYLYMRKHQQREILGRPQGHTAS